MYYHANIENQIKKILESINLLKHEEHNSENKLWFEFELDIKQIWIRGTK